MLWGEVITHGHGLEVAWRDGAAVEPGRGFGGGVDAGVEELLLRADRRVLRVLAPTPRCIILVLRVLRGRGGPVAREEIEASIEGLGFACPRLGAVLEYMEGLGLLSCSSRGCWLEEDGSAVADTLHDFLENVRGFAYKVLEGSVDESELFAEVVTATASAVGLAEAYAETPEYLPLYLTLHMYVSGISAMVLAMLARMDARLYEMLERVLQGI